MRSANNWLAFSLSPHLTIDAPDHAPTSQSNGPKVARHSSADNGMAYNGSASSEFYNPGQSEDDGLPMRSDGSLCIMEALSRSHSGDWAQLKTGHVQRSQHLLNAELSRFQAGSRAPSEQQISQNQYDSINKSDHETVPKLEDFLGGASSLGGQYSTRSDSQTHNFENLYFRDINVNLSPFSGGAQQQQQQQQASHVPPSFHAYGLQRTDNSSSQQPYDSHSRTNTAAATAAEPNLCHPNVHAQNLLQVALDQHRHPGSGAQGGEMLSDCTRQLPQGPNLSALKTWLQQSQAGAAPGGVNALGSAGGDKQPVGVGKASIPTLANLHQSLSLSMSPGSQSSNTLQVGHQQTVQAETSPETRKRGAGRAGSKEASPRKSIDNFGQRTSVFRGVTRHRWTGRYEAHLWDNSCRKEGQTRKGRQVYLGGYDKEEKAARAYDLAALKYWGANTTINFPLHQYEKEVEEMKNMTRQEYVASLRRKSSGFSRGASVYRGVTRHHQHGRWQARIGRVAGNKDLYLGTYSTQEEAAEAYDIAAIKFRGINAVTNFDISRYDTKRICGTVHNPGAGDTSEIASAAGNNSSKAGGGLPPITNQGSNYGQVLTKELQLVVMPEQPRSEVSVDQTDEDSQSLQTGNTNTSQGTDGGLVVSRPSHLQEWQMLYQQQTQRSWDDATSQQQQHQQQQQQQQDARTQSLMSMADSKFQQHHQQQQHDARTQSLMSMTDSKFQQQQQDARTQSLMSMTESKFQQQQQQDARTQSLMSLTESKFQQQQQQQDARTHSLMSMTESKFQQHQQQDVRTQSLMSMTESKFQQQQQQDARTQSLMSMTDSKFQQQQQDARTQSLMSMADSKFLPSANMHSAVLRNLMGLSDGGGSHSASENSGGLIGISGSGHGSNTMMGSNGHGGYAGTQQSPKHNSASQLSLRESEDDSSKNSGGGSAYENVLQGDFSRHMMYMSHKQSPPHGSQNSSVTNPGYDSSSLGGSSWMSPQAGLAGRVNLSVGHMPIFAVWNE